MTQMDAALWSRLPACSWGAEGQPRCNHRRPRVRVKERLVARPAGGGGGLGYCYGHCQGYGYGHGVPSAPAFWAAPGDPASHVQRDRLGVIVGLGPRCPHERRPPSELERTVTEPVECPARTLCGTGHGSGRSYLHNAEPGTSRWRGSPVTVSGGGGAM